MKVNHINLANLRRARNASNRELIAFHSSMCRQLAKGGALKSMVAMKHFCEIVLRERGYMLNEVYEWEKVNG